MLLSVIGTWLRFFAVDGLVKIAALFCTFIAVAWWFWHVDFYHRHFFDSGVIVLVDNLLRVVYVIILAWLVPSPGAGVAALLATPQEYTAVSAAERAVLGFGIGVGIWHVAMLIFGVLGLYYRAVMVGLCLVVLAASADILPRRGRRAAPADRWSRFAAAERARRKTGLMLLSSPWLLLRRGLFPGGGGDYYTHYFYYYLAVLKNHGLAPNDVWYHYYYSKGSGLVFLGMLLTDPEAPALTTFPCVIFAAVAIATLAARLMPGSLWPAAGALIYLLYYLLGFSDRAAANFRKTMRRSRHSWSSRRGRCAWSAGSAAAVSGHGRCKRNCGGDRDPGHRVVLSCFVGLFCAWSAVRRRWREMWAYGVVAAVIGGRAGMFVLSYVQTGLASDQAIDLMLRFADVGRLDRWGVIPQVIAVAWIRDNYRALGCAVRLGASSSFQFMRLRAVAVSARSNDRNRHLAGQVAPWKRPRPDRSQFVGRRQSGSPSFCFSRLRFWWGALRAYRLTGSAPFLFPCWCCWRLPAAHGC